MKLAKLSLPCCVSGAVVSLRKASRQANRRQIAARRCQRRLWQSLTCWAVAASEDADAAVWLSILSGTIRRSTLVTSD